MIRSIHNVQRRVGHWHACLMNDRTPSNMLESSSIEDQRRCRMSGGIEDQPVSTTTITNALVGLLCETTTRDSMCLMFIEQGESAQLLWHMASRCHVARIYKTSKHNSEICLARDEVTASLTNVSAGSSSSDAEPVKSIKSSRDNGYCCDQSSNVRWDSNPHHLPTGEECSSPLHHRSRLTEHTILTS